MIFFRSVHSAECFRLLLQAVQPDMVLDIGSRDGKDALLFRQTVQQARLLAFEANPLLCDRMRQDNRLADANIGVYCVAISNTNGITLFSIFHKDKKLGSLRAPSGWEVTEAFNVEAKRLDSFSELKKYKHIALWIDVEGCSYEVMEGLGELIHSVSFVHAEVETECLWNDQKLYPDFLHFMETHGFMQIGLEIKPRKHRQGNAVFIRRELIRDPAVRRVIVMANLRNLFALKSHARNVRYRLRKKYPIFWAYGRRIKNFFIL
ncbi:MAG: FkbM family methyltransferase [Parcubacteria group bacterium Gr01-1014_66]|nr:MAG: FkbM family methyltransferase [Parcubacteria group bacterium Gr01-1014_66]